MTATQLGAAEPRGLAGWLILPVLGVHASILFAISGLLGSLGEAMTVDGSRSDVAIFVYLTVVSDILILAGWIVAAALLWRRKAAFPRFFTAMCLAAIAVMAIDIAVLSVWFEVPVPRELFQAIRRTAVSSLIWIPYMFLSKRVRNTFTR